MRVVLDTNVFVSGIFWKGAPRKILELWEEHRFKLVISQKIFEEYSRVLHKLNQKFQLSSVEEILDHIPMHSTFYSPPRIETPICDDEKDQMFLDLAVFCDAHYLVSGDDDLLRIKSYPGGVIVTPARFVQILSPLINS